MVQGPCGSPCCWRLGEWDRTNRTAHVVHFKFPRPKMAPKQFRECAVTSLLYRPTVDYMREECNTTHVTCLQILRGPTCVAFF
jgi:hypothetical protein